MTDAIVRYIITLKEHRQLALYNLGATDDSASEALWIATIDFLDTIIADLEGFVKQGGYEDLMKQALLEAYGGIPEWEKEAEEDADQPDPYGGI